MGFLIVNLISTTVSVVLTLWLTCSDLLLSTNNHCQTITEDMVPDTVEIISSQLKSGNNERLGYLWDALECSENMSTEMKENAIALIIEKTYNKDLNYFDTVLNFIQAFVKNEDLRNMGYLDLYEQMNISNHIFNTIQLFSLARVIQTETFADELLEAFPKEVGLILHHREVSLWNVENKGYLILGGRGIFYDSIKKQRHVMIWNPGNLGPQGKWKLIMNEDGSTFRIVNTFWNQCLYKDTWEKRFDDKRGSVYSSSCDVQNESTGNWNLVLLPPGKENLASYVQIQSSDEPTISSLLFSDRTLSFDSFRSRVFISYAPDFYNQSFWKISIT